MTTFKPITKDMMRKDMVTAQTNSVGFGHRPVWLTMPTIIRNVSSGKKHTAVLRGAQRHPCGRAIAPLSVQCLSCLRSAALPCGGH